MSKLDDLMKEYCNGGVEYKTLGEVCEIKRGTRVVKNQLPENGKYLVYQNSMTPLGCYDKANCKEDTTFVIAAGAAGEIGYSENPFWAADDCYYFECPENLKSKYLYHFLLSQKSCIISKVRKASIPRLPRTAVESLSIPLPPLPVQEEIVRILDAFTKLTAELTAELTARRKQYEYYRDALLSFDTVNTPPYTDIK